MKYGLIATLLVALAAIGCNREPAPKTLYEKMEREALKSGVKQDSLIFGLSFGMEKTAFFEHCAEMNKDSILYQGAGGKVEHKLINNELKHKGTVNFYPEFHEQKVWKLPVVFSYDGWSPWNKDFQAPKLRRDVADLLMKWHGGNDFFETPHPMDTVTLVKIDGNRRILLECDGSGAFVTATYTDLLVEKQLNQAQEATRKEEEKE